MGLIVPGLPHPLLCPEQNPGWQALRDAYDTAAARIAQQAPDLLLLYATQWPSVIGHQIQARPLAEWTHTDELFHDLGSIPYRFHMDASFGGAFRDAAIARGLQARTVDYHGFPIDTGSVVALRLLDPDGAVPACIVSSNVYADRAETVVLAKAASDALAAQGKRAVAVMVMTLSNRFFTDFIRPEDDRIHSAKDDEYNRKLLELLADGRLEDTAQLSREIHRQIRVKKVVSFKPFWFLSALMGAHNRYRGEVLAYAPVHGAGAAVVSLVPSEAGVGIKEFDEDDVERFAGDREVLATGPASAAPTAAAAPEAPPNDAAILTDTAPRPVGAYPHARRVGDLLYLSGIGPRDPADNSIPGGPIRDASGAPRDYDIQAQTEAVIENVRRVLHAAGSNLDRVVDVTAFLVDMDRDFAGYNAVYARHFTAVGATRTTVAVSALPTPIAVEFKVTALAGPGP